MIDLSNLAQKLGISEIGLLFTLIITVFVIYQMYNKINDKTKKKKFLVWSSAGLVILLITTGVISFGQEKQGNISLQEKKAIDLSNSDLADWQKDYADIASKEISNYDMDVQNTKYYDYENTVITEIAKRIAFESESAQDAIENAAKYVYDNVEYVWGESDDACYDGTAPEILASGKGQCDTQAITLISLLRRMGIVTKPVGGCIVPNPECRLQAIFLNSLKGIIKSPKYIELGSVNPNATTFSRADIASRKGGLHAWVTAWLPDKGWVNVEETTGKLADTKCWYYHVELFPEDDKKDDICVSKNWDYAKACQTSDLESLDKFGLGLVSEVSP